MDWKTMLAYISGSVDEEPLLRNECLVAKKRILRNQIQGCLRLTDDERRTLAEIKKASRQASPGMSKLILFGENSLRHALTHHHNERNHQGKDNLLLFPALGDSRGDSRGKRRNSMPRKAWRAAPFLPSGSRMSFLTTRGLDDAAHR